MPTSEPMKFRKLRIAWSVAWGLIALLLCVLWVRSYRVVTAALFDQSPALVLKDGQFIYDADFAWDGRCRKTQNAIQLSRNSRMIVQSIVPGGRGVEIFKYGRQLKLWPFAVAAVLVTALPWIRQANRFSLRTLLIAITLGCIGLTLIVWVVK